MDKIDEDPPEDPEIVQLITDIGSLAALAGRRFEPDSDKVKAFSSALAQARVRARDAVALGMARDRD